MPNVSSVEEIMKMSAAPQLMPYRVVEIVGCATWRGY